MTDSQTAIQKICEAPEWWYFTRRFCYPLYNHIVLGDDPAQSPSASASGVFAALQLNLEVLIQIFGRQPDTAGDSYDHLGGFYCYNSPQWTDLARLSGKVIHLVFCHDIHGSQHVATYYPDGTVTK